MQPAVIATSFLHRSLLVCMWIHSGHAGQFRQLSVFLTLDISHNLHVSSLVSTSIQMALVLVKSLFFSSASQDFFTVFFSNGLDNWSRTVRASSRKMWPYCTYISSCSCIFFNIIWFLAPKMISTEEVVWSFQLSFGPACLTLAIPSSTLVLLCCIHIEIVIFHSQLTNMGLQGPQ